MSRLKFISYMQAIAIVLVVLGHSLQMYPDGAGGYSTIGSRLIYSFHMPLFIFVSGFLMLLSLQRGNRSTSTAGRFLTSRSRRLLLPYLVLTLVTFIPRAAMSSMAADPVELSLPGLWRGLTDREGLVIPYFWFVQALFVVSVSVYALLKVAEGIRIGRLIPLVIAVAVSLALRGSDIPAFFALDRAAELALYFAAGGLYCLYSEQVDSVISWHNPLIFLLLTALWFGSFMMFEGSLFEPITALAGIAMIISLSKIFEHHGIGVLDHLEGATYLIFLLSWYCNVAAQQILAHFVSWPWWTHTLLSLFAGIYIPLAVHRCLLRHPDSRLTKFARYILGQ